MKILQVNNVYGERSTGKLTRTIHEGLLAAGHESVVVYGRGHGLDAPGVIRLCPEWYGRANSLLSRLTGMMYGGCLLSTARLKAIIRREKPDVVHLQCINGYFVNIYRLVRWLKEQRIKTVVSLHAEFMYTANCGHAFDCRQWQHGCSRCPDRKKATKSLFFDGTGRSWRTMRQAFAGFAEDCLVCPVSPWTEERARQADILKGLPLRTVFNGVDTKVFSCGPAEQAREDLALHVTAHFSDEKEHPKGGWYLLELARRMPETTFLVVGRAEVSGAVPENVKLLGVVADQLELARLYRRARLTVLVSRRETFSMPCAESLCCGTPVVGFRAGAPEGIALAQYSEFVDYGDLDGLEAAVHRWLGRQEEHGAIAAEAADQYGAETMVRTWIDIYGGME